MNYTKIAIGILCALTISECGVLKQSSGRKSPPFERSTWTILSIENQGSTTAGKIYLDSCACIEFGTTKAKTYGQRGDFKIFNRETNPNRKCIALPFLGYYITDDSNKITIGWTPHKSYNPEVSKSEIGKLIWSSFSFDGTYKINGDSLKLSSLNSEIKIYLLKREQKQERRK